VKDCPSGKVNFHNDSLNIPNKDKEANGFADLQKAAGKSGKISGCDERNNDAVDLQMAAERTGKTLGLDVRYNQASFPLRGNGNEALTHYVEKASVRDFIRTSKAQTTHGFGRTLVHIDSDDDGSPNTERVEVTTVPFEDDDDEGVRKSEIRPMDCEPKNTGGVSTTRDKVSKTASDDAARALVGEVSRQHRERKATKSDDAEIPEDLWEDHLLSDGPTPWVVSDRTRLREGMWLLRRRMLRWWQRNVTITFLRWVHSSYSDMSGLDSQFGKTVIFDNNRYVWAPESNTDGRKGYREWWKQRLLLAGKDLHPAGNAIGRAA
jgi:hypothetical protein